MNEIAIKKLREMSLKQQLLFCESYLPDAWEYLHDTADVQLPKFDDNDEVISWGVTPKDTPQKDAKEEQS
jgi:hypothetical protein